MKAGEAKRFVSKLTYQVFTPSFEKIHKLLDGQTVIDQQYALDNLDNETDALLRQVEVAWPDAEAVDQIYRRSDPRLIKCVGYRATMLLFYLGALSPDADSGLPALSKSRAISSAFVDSWYTCRERLSSPRTWAE